MKTIVKKCNLGFTIIKKSNRNNILLKTFKEAHKYNSIINSSKAIIILLDVLSTIPKQSIQKMSQNIISFHLDIVIITFNIEYFVSLKKFIHCEKRKR